MDTQFSSWTFTVPRAGSHAEVLHAGLSDDAATAGGSATVLDAGQPFGARTRAGHHRPLAADDGRWVARETIGTEAVGLVVAHFADGVRSTEALDLARILAPVLGTCLVQLTVAVFPAAHLAVARTEASLLGGTVRMGEAGVHAAAVDALLARGTVALTCAHQAALLVNTGISRRTVVVTQADDRLAAAALCRVTTKMGLALASGSMSLCTADGVGATLEMVAGILAHGLSHAVRVTC